MTNRPLVSVVVPHHHRGQPLALCLDALAAQTYDPIEVIVVDDASTDGSVAVARERGVTVVRTAANVGQSAARNLGAEHARGQILFFLDSDIALDPDAIAHAVAALRADPGLGAVCGILHPEPLIPRGLMGQYRALQMYHWWMPTEGPTRELHAALLAVPAPVFADVGPFDPALRDTEAADYRTRLVQRYRVQLTGTIRGRHDHDHTLSMVLGKVFRRARISAIEWRRGELPGDSTSRAFSGALVTAAALAVPLPLLLGPAGAAAAPLLLAAGITLDGRTYRAVFAHRGVAFGTFFTTVHLLVTLTGTAGMAAGVLQRLLFRRRPPHGQGVPVAVGTTRGTPD
ncbi:glycosyltransferase [Actinomycetes bacterium KLBMP 9797]